MISLIISAGFCIAIIGIIIVAIIDIIKINKKIIMKVIGPNIIPLIGI